LNFALTHTRFVCRDRTTIVNHALRRAVVDVGGGLGDSSSGVHGDWSSFGRDVKAFHAGHVHFECGGVASNQYLAVIPADG